MPSNLSTNFGVYRYYQKEYHLNGVCSGNNLGNIIMDGRYPVDFDEFANIETFCVIFYIKNDEAKYFDRFGQLMPKKIKKFIGNRNIKANIFRMQTFGSITFG